MVANASCEPLLEFDENCLINKIFYKVTFLKKAKIRRQMIT